MGWSIVEWQVPDATAPWSEQLWDALCLSP